MSGARRSVGPVRQLSLQQPAPRRQHVRRQRSAEDEKSLQVYANPVARGKLGASTKSASDRPKVRVAWSENRRKNEKQEEEVEVVARQIPGRSRPTTGRSRGFSAEKASILYSRQELAERLRLAWKHREENKANIDIFLAHGTLEERCDSALSSLATITAPSTPLPKRDVIKSSSQIGLKVHQNDRALSLTQSASSNEDLAKLQSENSEVVIKNNDDTFNCKKNEKRELSINIENWVADGKNIARESEVESQEYKEEQEPEGDEKEGIIRTSTEAGVNEQLLEVKKGTTNIQSPTLPSLKPDKLAVTTNVTNEETSSARQKRASFHSGTNRAFLGPIRASAEPRAKSVAEKISVRTVIETKDNTAIDKTATTTDNKSNARTKASVENTDALSNDKFPLTRDTTEEKCNSAGEKSSVQRISEAKPSSPREKIPAKLNAESWDNFKKENACIEKSVFPKKNYEVEKVDQKSRRTSSAPPQRHLGVATSSSQRVQVNIVIDTPSTLGSTGKSNACTGQDAEGSGHKAELLEQTESPFSKIPCTRTVRSAPLKRRSKSARRRLFGANYCKNDEDGRSKSRSGSRGKNSIDSRTIDLVTMVSLVSSADSDSDAENSPGDDKLINELRSKLPTTSIIKTSMNPTPNTLKKPVKSVSFQKDSDEESSKEPQVLAKEEKKVSQPRLSVVNNRGNSGSLPSCEETLSWRTDIPGLALPVLALIHDVEETVEVPLTDREKRCLAVPIGELHDKKRKLLRTRSTPTRPVIEKSVISMEIKEQKAPENPPRAQTSEHQNKPPIDACPPKTDRSLTGPTKDAEEEIRILPSEPHFQTRKEKECWHLYRKMCDKGVCVSFDTVLRGMLTPTEYRLRQKELL